MQGFTVSRILVEMKIWLILKNNKPGICFSWKLKLSCKYLTEKNTIFSVNTKNAEVQFLKVILLHFQCTLTVYVCKMQFLAEFLLEIWIQIFF